MPGATENPLYFGPSPPEPGLGVLAAGPPWAFVYTGGTGIYEGAAGHGRCLGPTALSAHPTGVQSISDLDCTSRLALGAAAAYVEPVTLEMGAAVVRMTVFASSVDLPKKAYFNVLFFNPHDQKQKGLSLKLHAPDGAEVLFAARGENEPASPGERVWALPDLGIREVGRFEFSVEVLSARAKTIPLVSEINGDGFKRPVRSDLLTIAVVK